MAWHWTTAAGLGACLLAGLGGRDGTVESANQPARGPSAAAWTHVAGRTPEDCGACHRELHAEWGVSAHAKAFVHAEYQAALATRKRPEYCMPCHAPVSVLDRLGRMPELRQEDRVHGITCASCHSRGETVCGPYGASTPAHPTSKDAAFGERGSIALCSGCHDRRIADVLPVAEDFERAGFADQGMSCVGCHMPSRTRAIANDPVSGAASGPEREGRSHHIRGPGEAAFSARAFSHRLVQDGTKATLFVTNEAGHRVPGLARGRTFAMRFRQLGADGRSLGEARLDIHGANPLLAAEERAVELDWHPLATRLEVRVEHIHGDRPPQLVETRELTPEPRK